MSAIEAVLSVAYIYASVHLFLKGTCGLVQYLTAPPVEPTSQIRVYNLSTIPDLDDSPLSKPKKVQKKKEVKEAEEEEKKLKMD